MIESTAQHSSEEAPRRVGTGTIEARRGSKLLVISHACVTPVNQSFFSDVARTSGWSVDLVIPASWDSEYQKDLKVTRWPDFEGEIYPLPVWKAGNIPLHVYRSFLMGLFRRVNPTYIYVHHEPYGLATAQCYLANRLTVNCPIGFYAAQNLYKDYPPPFRWFEQWVLRHSAFSFPVTQSALEILRRKGFEGNATVLPLALDPVVYHPRTEWAAAKRVELGLSVNQFVVGYIGRLVEEKGLKALLEATSALHGTEWRLILVGSGPYEAALRSIALEMGVDEQLHFIGFVPHQEVPGWLTLFDVLVLASESRPNWKEQFGRVIIEANACETAVIGTESGEIGNVIRATGGGMIVPESDPAALGSALAALARDPVRTKSLATTGAAAVKEKYDQLVLASRFSKAVLAATAQKV